MGSVRVAIVGVGNCATSLIQGVEYYKDADPEATVPGLMHVMFGDYHVRDVEFVAAFDVDDKKVGKDLSEAINASENNTIKIADVPTLGIDVQRGPTLDGLGKYYRQTIEESAVEAVDVVQVAQGLRRRRDGVLPPGGLRGGRQVLRPVRDRRRRRLRQRPARLHRLRPRVGQEVRGRRRPDRRRRHQEPGRRHHHPPRDGEAVRGPRRRARPHLPAQRRRQHGLQEHARARAPGVQEGLQDPGRHLQPAPASWPTRSTTATSTSARPTTSPWLDDRKWAYVRLEGRAFGDVPLNLEYKLEVWDSPNSAGIIIDALRACKIAKDRGLGGPIISASSYLMKSPPVQIEDDEGRRRVEAFIAGEE